MRKIAFFWRKLRRLFKKVKLWQVFLLFVLTLVLAVLALRNNNLEMVKLRDTVIAADKAGNSEELEEAALRLQNYVAKHMNTDTGQIALQNTYDQAVEEAFKNANQLDGSQSYDIATEKCKALAVNGYQAYAQCVADEVGVSSSDFTKPELPNPGMFYLSFSAPIISFDLAGWLVIFTIFFAILSLFFLLGKASLLLFYNRKSNLI